ncbi:putative Chilling-induced protein [Quillaja saponaria]|uniref:Chilling-induced protein n=1 Tax=Quillaja saponaria TaxID=32244 RepID=A0AAD7L0P0_QUISA|nr:putative Chilling-induced protein [Quillaja saponaria]
MATKMTFLAKKSSWSVSFKAFANGLQSTSKKACFSTAYQPAQGDRNETNDNRTKRYNTDESGIPVTNYNSNTSAGSFEGVDDIANPVIKLKDEDDTTSTEEEDDDQDDDDNNIGRGVTGFVADTARQGAKKAAEVVENVADTAKETVDIAWDTTKKATRNIKGTAVAEADANVVDTLEYRSAEDLKGHGEGYDKKDKQFRS